MKKVIIFICLISVVLSLTSCGLKNENANVTTKEELSLFCKQEKIDTSNVDLNLIISDYNFKKKELIPKKIENIISDYKKSNSFCRIFNAPLKTRKDKFDCDIKYIGLTDKRQECTKSVLIDIPNNIKIISLDSNIYDNLNFYDKKELASNIKDEIGQYINDCNLTSWAKNIVPDTADTPIISVNLSILYADNTVYRFQYMGPSSNLEKIDYIPFVSKILE